MVSFLTLFPLEIIYALLPRNGVIKYPFDTEDHKRRFCALVFRASKSGTIPSLSAFRFLYTSIVSVEFVFIGVNLAPLRLIMVSIGSFLTLFPLEALLHCSVPGTPKWHNY